MSGVMEPVASGISPAMRRGAWRVRAEPAGRVVAVVDDGDDVVGVGEPASPNEAWTARCFSDSACFVLQAAFFRSRNSLSTSSGVRYPRAE